MVVLVDLPFVFAEIEFFEEFIQNNLCPQFKKIFKNTVRNDAIRLWQSEKENIKNYFTDIPGRIAITTNIWSSRGDDSYLLYYCP